MSRLSFHAVALHACCLMLCCVQSRGHNFSGASETDFPGLVPPGGQAESCVAAYRRLSHLHCEGVESTDPSITVQRCYQEAGDAHGVIAFHSNTGSAGQQVYRLRITGPEILLPDILYCGDSAAYAEYTAFTPGDYRAEILHLYEDFSYASSHPALKLQMVLGELDFYVSAPPRKTAGYPQSGLAMLTSGRWVVSAKHHRAFHRTCVTESDKFDACSEAVRTLSSDTDDTLLHWQPHFCPRLAREQDLDLRACLANKRVCFSGDSQMRHAYNGFVALSDGRAQAADYWHNLRHNDHSVLESRFSSYQSNVWGNEVATENCSILFFNVGQWPASYLSEGRPWSAGQYIQQTSQLAARLARAQGEGTSMYWRVLKYSESPAQVTTNPFPLRADMHRQNTDWRTDPILLLYNSLAQDVMQAAGIEIISTWNLAAPLADFSYDRGHYKGVVGYHISLLLINIVCNFA